MRMSLKMIT